MESMTDKETMTKIALGMSNMGHTIDDGLSESLREHPNQVMAQYSGWDFCGYVWHNGNQFMCQVWTYKSPQEEIAADSLEDIMARVSEKYGAD